MATTPLTKQAVDSAPPLDFPQRRQELGFTVKATMNGYPVEINFSGDIDQLQRITRRLAELGAEPQATAPAAQQQKPRAQRVAPAYADDGSAICPVHRKPLSFGQFGPYCSCRATGDQVANKNGYCGLKFQD